MEVREELQRQLKLDTNNVELREHYRTAKTYVKTLMNRSKHSITKVVKKIVNEIPPQFGKLLKNLFLT